MASTKSADLGFPIYVCFCAFVAAISGFNVGWHIGVPNMPAKIITQCPGGETTIGGLPSCLPMDSFTWGYTVGAFALGGLAGALATTYLNVWFTRRQNIIISCGLYIVGGVLSAASAHVVMYAVGRAFVGLASGGAGSSVAIYISEISTKRCRGALGSVFEFLLNMGILLSFVAGRYMAFAPVWRLGWAIPTIVAGIQMLTMIFFCAESPRRLCADGKYDDARAALQRFRKGADITEEYQDLIDARQREIESGVQKMSMLDVILCKDRHVSWNTFIVVMIQASNQVGGIGPLSGMLSLSSLNMYTIIYAASFLTTVLNGNSQLASDISLVNATGKIVATFITIFTLNKVGRKGFMLISSLGMSIFCMFIVIGAVLGETREGLGPLVICGAVAYTFVYAMGCGTIPWIIAPELLPLKALPPGSALGGASNWFFNFLINTLWPQQLANLGNYSFIVFAVVNFILFLFFLFFMPETTGRDLDEKKAPSGDVENHGSAGSTEGNSFSDEVKQEKTHIEHVN
ncbi:general substrate transporter [Radiomyces spectabilis]|uniref:general substrate transporter n=1 Tax=Radiomyces spectabilis TaxID=64574 RepID=UPI00221FBF79|nr:general substrate transporter [Radiomyces spectabilis]KAI8369586.1 general substrate transporter [Radiomyces spectabilis]